VKNWKVKQQEQIIGRKRMKRVEKNCFKL